MFLNKLEDHEKNAFLTLAHHVARSDGEFSENEQDVIAIYCMEMQISDVGYDKDSFELDLILEKFKRKESQKILLLEIMALVYSDGLKEEEKGILKEVADKFNISSSLSAVFAEWSKSILSISSQGQALIRL